MRLNVAVLGSYLSYLLLCCRPVARAKTEVQVPVFERCEVRKSIVPTISPLRGPREMGTKPELQGNATVNHDPSVRAANRTVRAC